MVSLQFSLTVTRGLGVPKMSRGRVASTAAVIEHLPVVRVEGGSPHHPQKSEGQTHAEDTSHCRAHGWAAMEGQSSGRACMCGEIGQESAFFFRESAGPCNYPKQRPSSINNINYRSLTLMCPATLPRKVSTCVV